MKKFLIVTIFFFLISYLIMKNDSKSIIYVYDDEGVSEESLKHTVNALNLVPKKYSVKTITAQEIIKNKWLDEAILLVMPGGADLPYVKKLNGVANESIKNFVYEGGAYLGICAGAYYASGYVEFDKGGELEVLGERELSFFPGKAIGPILSSYDYRNNSGVRAARIKMQTMGELSEVNLYFNGGGFFENAEDYTDVQVLGNYQINNIELPAIIHIKYGAGNVVLSGVHFEYDTSLLDIKDKYIENIIEQLKNTEDSRKSLIKKILQKLTIE